MLLLTNNYDNSKSHSIIFMQQTVCDLQATTCVIYEQKTGVKKDVCYRDVPNLKIRLYTCTTSWKRAEDSWTARPSMSSLASSTLLRRPLWTIA